MQPAVINIFIPDAKTYYNPVSSFYRFCTYSSYNIIFNYSLKYIIQIDRVIIFKCLPVLVSKSSSLLVNVCAFTVDILFRWLSFKVFCIACFAYSRDRRCHPYHNHSYFLYHSYPNLLLNQKHKLYHQKHKPYHHHCYYNH